MPIINLHDFWKWFESNQYFVQSLKEHSLDDLQFLPNNIDSKDHLDIYRIEESRQQQCLQDDAFNSKSRNIIFSKDDEEKSVFTNQCLDFYYQRLVGAILIGHQSDRKLDNDNNNQNYSDKCSSSSGGMINHIQSKNSNKKIENSNEENFDYLKKDSLQSPGLIDISWMSLQHRTTAILGISGILSPDMIRYENGIDVIEVAAEFSGDFEFDAISSELRIASVELSKVELTVNHRLAELRKNISCCESGDKFKGDKELRSLREYEKSLYTKWQKYQKKNYNILTVADHNIGLPHSSGLGNEVAFEEIPW